MKRESTPQPAMPANTFNVPQSLSSRAAYAEPPSSDSTVREDIDMQASDQAGDIAADGDDAIERFGRKSC